MYESAHTAAHAIVVFAHGSRDPLWKLPVQAVAQRVAALRPLATVRCAYLELCEPDLPTVVAELLANASTRGLTIRVFPLFFGVGKHAREDLPAIVAALRLEHPHCSLELIASAGEHDGVLDAAAQAALA